MGLEYELLELLFNFGNCLPLRVNGTLVRVQELLVPFPVVGREQKDY